MLATGAVTLPPSGPGRRLGAASSSARPGAETEIRPMKAVKAHTYFALTITFALALGGCASNRGGASTSSTGFEQSAGGGMPSGWMSGESDGVGKPARWSVERDESAPVDPQVFVCRAQNPEPTFNWCVQEQVLGPNVAVTALVKPLTGIDDQGGGIVFRFQDGGNYYLTRWNPLENNVRLYYVKNGVRRILGDAPTTATPGWRRLSAEAVGDRIVVSFDGKVVIEKTDATFKAGGKAGLWTKADAATSFDDFSAKSL